MRNAIVHVQKYEDWKEGLPDMKWLEDALPQSERWSQFSRNLIEVGSVVKNAIDIGESIHKSGLIVDVHSLTLKCHNS